MNTDGTRWQFLAAVADIPEAGLGFTYKSGPFAQGGILVRTKGGVRGWLNRCRHLAVPLDHNDPGHFSTDDGRHMVCSMHGALYRPEGGMCVAGPCLGAALRRLPVRVRDRRVFLDTEALIDPFSSSQAPP